MRTTTLKKFNLLTVLLLVIAIAVTCTAFYIGGGIKSIIDKGHGEQVDMSISDNTILTDTNGTLTDNAELIIPDGYTGVPITSEAELKAFILDSDTATLKYGYLQPSADGNAIGSIGLDWAANGAPSGITANKILDGRGFTIELNTVGTVGGDFVRQTIDKAGSLINKDIRTGGLFVTSNFGTIKNVQFSLSKAISYICAQEWTTTYGIVTGYNAGVIDNVSLDIKVGATFKVDKKESASPTANTDQCTVLVGGIAGTNASATDGLGVIKNTSVNNDGELWARAKYHGKDGLWGSVKGTSRSSLGMLVGRMQGLTTLVQNSVVKGAGSMKAETSGNAKVGSVYRNVATAVASNSGYSGTQDNAFGKINGIIDAFSGSISSSTSSSKQTGTFDCAENTSNIYRPMARAQKWIMNCNCDHVFEQTYRTIESKGALLHYGFTANAGEVTYNTAMTDTEKAEQKLYTEEKYDVATGGNKDNQTITISTTNVVKSITEDIATDISGTLSADKASVFESLFIAYYHNVEITPIIAEPSAYDGRARKTEYTAKYKGEEFTLDFAEVNSVFMRDGNVVTDSVLPGVYTVEMTAKNNTNAAYYQEKDGVIYATKKDNSLIGNFTINLAAITTNSAGIEWVKTHTYAIDLTGFAAGAIEKLEVSIDDGLTWAEVAGTTYTVSTNGDNVVHQFRGYKGSTVVTEILTADPIKFDNVAPIIDTPTYSLPIDEWTTSDIVVTFTSSDAVSGLKSLVVTNSGTDVDASVGENNYSYTMTNGNEYVLIVTDNAGNVTEHKVVAKIDQVDPTITLAPTFYTPDGEVDYADGKTAYSPITINIHEVVGARGATISYGEIVDGNVATWTVLEAVDGKYFIKYAEETNKSLRFKIVNGFGVEKTVDINIVISRHRLTITYDNILFEDGALTKKYDATNNVLGSMTMQNLMDGSEVLDANLYKHFTVTAVYNDKVVGSGKEVTYTLTVDPDYATEYIIDDKITNHKTSDGVVEKRDVKLNINEQTRQYYDANPALFSYTFSDVLNSEENEITVDLSYGATKEDNVGKYNINFISHTAVNYNVILATDNEQVGKLIITQRSAIVEFENWEGLKYDGTEQSLNAYYFDVYKVKHNLNVTYDKAPINAGSYVATAAFPADSNYKNSTGVDTWEFKIAKTTPSITAEDKTVNYDTVAHAIAYQTDSSLPIVVKYNGSEAAPINAGRYVAEITIVGDENYNSVTIEVVLTINKITFEGTLTFEDKTVTYNGEKQSLAVSGAPQDATISYKNNDNINVGKYLVEAIVTNVNYSDFTVKANLTIVKKVFDKEIKMDSKTGIYNGAAYGVAVEGAPQDAIITYDHNNFINAGSYKVKATITGDNYETIVLFADIIIEQAAIPSDIKFDDTNSEFYFDGLEHTFTLLGDLTGFKVVYKNNIAFGVGVSTASATVTSDSGNYKKTVLQLAIKVTRVEVDIIYNGIPAGNTVKQGQAMPNVTASYVDVNGNVVEVELTVSGDLNSANGYVTIKPVLGRNYVASDATSLIYIDVEENQGASTAVIVGASVGGSVGGLAIAGGLVAFFVIKKKKSII